MSAELPRDRPGAFEGRNARSISVADLDDRTVLWSFFAALVSDAASGLLTVVSHEGVVSAALRSGWLVGIKPEHQSGDVGLGEFLIASGKLGRARYEALTEIQAAGGRRLRDLLLEHGDLERETLESEQRRWAHETLCEALLWDDAVLTFYPGHVATHLEAMDPSPLADFLLAHAERLSARMPVPSDLPGPDSRFVKAEQAVALDERPSLDEFRVLEELSEPETVARVAERSALSLPAVRIILWQVERQGGVRRLAAAEPEVAADRAAAKTAATGDRMPTPSELPRAAPRSRALLASCMLVALASLLLGVVIRPDRILLPLPGEADARSAWEGSRVETARQALGRAGAIFSLIEGRRAEGGTTLVRYRLLDERTLLHLRSPEDVGVVRLDELPGEENFLLEPFEPSEPVSEVAPLVLLD